MFLTRRFYIVMTVVILVLASGYLWYPAFIIGRWMLLAFVIAVATDIVRLWSRRGITAERHCPDRLSNGDDNKVSLVVTNSYRFAVSVEVIDEVPVEFQQRDVCYRLSLPKDEQQRIDYHLHPTHRGSYAFGVVQVFVTPRQLQFFIAKPHSDLGQRTLQFFSPSGFVQRRYRCASPQQVKVYPSFLMLHQYELLAASRHLVELGIKRIRRIGNHTEFEQIKDYVQGDDYRTINWRATARRHQLMINVYQDERSQQIYNVIDKGRVMQQTFNGMTLFDYAINASLVLSYVAMQKEDKAGLITFAEHFDSFIPASRQYGQLQTLLEALYAQQTTFGESDFSALAAYTNQYVSKRSLMVLYTNFLDRIALQRQLPFFRQLNRRHKLLVVFFEDEELKDYAGQPAEDVEQQFQKVIAGKMVYEKRLIVSTLKQNGIAALLTPPASLSVNIINKYLELKQTRI
jgi:uncharacterized protein (DUF58 family)